MSKTRTFRNTTGYGFTIHAPQQTIRVEADTDFATDDETVAQILEDSGRVEEVKASSSSKKADESDAKSESSGSKKDD